MHLSILYIPEFTVAADRQQFTEYERCCLFLYGYVRNEQPSYYELHSWLNKITLIIIKHCNDKKIPASCYIDYTESLQFLYNYHSLEEIESTILSMIESIFEKIAEQTRSTNAYLVEQVQNYLFQHMNENITLSDLGEIFRV